MGGHVLFVVPQSLEEAFVLTSLETWVPGGAWGRGSEWGRVPTGGLQLWGLPTACHLPCFLHGPAGLSAWQGAERDSWSVRSGSVPTTPL